MLSLAAGKPSSTLLSRMVGCFVFTLIVGMTVMTPSVAVAQDVEPAKPAAKEKNNPAINIFKWIGIPVGLLVAISVIVILVLALRWRQAMPPTVPPKMQEKGIVVAAIVVGIILTLGPVCGLGGAMIGQVRSFRQLGEAEGAPNAADLAGEMSLALYSTFAGCAACPVGIGILGYLLAIYLAKKNVGQDKILLAVVLIGVATCIVLPCAVGIMAVKPLN
jgi:hypothetical protein